MGIPYYFYKVTQQFNNIVSPNKQQCDRLFLDFNGIIHNCFNTIKTLDDYNSDIELEETLIKEVIKYTKIIYEYVEPKELLYICIDGVAPLPKIQQQRKRRFMSCWLKNQIKQFGYEWDSNAISPGTTFMENLSEKLKKYFSETILPFEVIISDSSEQGEGEHKIFDYIHFREKTRYVDVIYGLDADLIMLSLICNKSKKFLLREPIHFKSKSSVPFYWFNIDAFKHNLKLTMTNISIESYVFICFFLGNDFIPALSYLNIRNNGIETLQEIYSKVKNDFPKSEIIQFNDTNENYEINFDFLTNFIELLSQNEDIKYKQFHDKYFEKTMICSTNKDKIENYGVFFKSYPKINMNSKNWRSDYYIELFNATLYGDKIMTNSCDNYIKGLKWIVDYYFNKNAKNNWYYKYNYSPTILDIYNFLEEKAFKTDNNEHMNINTDEQLLMILPKQSFKLLNPLIKKEIKNSAIHNYYPITCYIESYLKQKLHECIPKLPQIDINEIKYIYLKSTS
jgi:5'-3' exonuclease